MTPSDLILTHYGVWYLGRGYICTTGTGGIKSNKREGDGGTPRGAHQIAGFLYRPDRIPKPNRWAKSIGHTDLWSDDANDVHNNHHVKLPYAHSY
jgi:L,D-peptidoglycan transpeptidase YkuD (ErfK/YbiS/YcfS/YnhG family)